MNILDFILNKFTRVKFYLIHINVFINLKIINQINGNESERYFNKL